MSQRRRPIFTTRLSRARDAGARFIARPFNWFRPTTQFIIAFTFLSIVTTLLLSRTHTQVPMEMYREVDVVRASVIAPADISYEDPQLTEAARATNPSAPPVTGFLRRNQVVAREGDTVTARMLAQIDAIRRYSHQERRPEHYLGLLFLVAALYWGAWKFVEHRALDKALPLSNGKTYTLLTSAILIETLLMRVGVIMAKSIAAQYERAPWNDATILSFAIPFAAATLLVALLMDVQLALITAIITAIFAGLLAPNGVMMA